MMQVLKENKLWDKRVADLEVTEIDDRMMQLRATYSNRNATSGWDLRCSIREELMCFIDRSYPEGLPKSGRVDADTT